MSAGGLNRLGRVAGFAVRAQSYAVIRSRGARDGVERRAAGA